MKKTLAAIAAVLALGAAVPLAAIAGDDDRRGDDRRGDDRRGYEMHGHHGDRHGPGARLRLAGLLETYDADADGAITQAEVDQFRAERLAAFDADGNGQLSLDEYEALWLDAMRERMVDRFQSHDDDGDAQVTVEEFAQPTARLVLRRDRNEDGVLNMDDLRRGPRGERGQGAPAQAGEPAQQQ